MLRFPFIECLYRTDNKISPIGSFYELSQRELTTQDLDNSFIFITVSKNALGQELVLHCLVVDFAIFKLLSDSFMISGVCFVI